MCYYDIVEKISYEDEQFANWFPPEPVEDVGVSDKLTFTCLSICLFIFVC